MAIGDVFTQYGQSIAQRGSQLATSTAYSAINQARGMAQSAVNSTINKALGMLPAPLRGITGSLTGGASGGGSIYNEKEDFNALRQINKKLVRAAFVQEWNFRLEIEGEPTDFNLYVKDISYGGFELGADEENVGSATFSWPNSEQPIRISVTAREDYDLRISNFIHTWAEKTVRKDGTVGLPMGDNGYTKKASLYNLTTSGSETLQYQFLCYPLQYGDATRSRENGQFLEMPITLVVFSTLYNS